MQSSNPPNLLEILQTAAKPAIAVSFADAPSLATLIDVQNAGMDVAELRFDLYNSLSAEGCDELVQQSTIPVIATLRHADEGGGWQQSEAERITRYRSWLSQVAAIDIELGHQTTIDEIADDCRNSNTTLIGSFHDFEKTPSAEILQDVIQRAVEAGVDIVKIAASVNSEDDLRRLAQALALAPTLPKIVLGMGPQGKISRLAFPALGSLLSFAYIGKPTAPGQPSLSELLQARHQWFGGDAPVTY